MRAEDFLAALRSLPLRQPLDVISNAPFVVLAPHPDDESLGTGGLIAAACAHGIDVRVVVLTDGSGSHPHSARYTRHRLIELRRTESEQAAACLGLPPGNLTHLGLHDTAAPSDGPLFHRAVDAIAGIVTAAQARSLLVTWRGDPHCDHVAAAVMARALRRRIPTLTLWSYPIWGWHLDPQAEVGEPPPRGARVDIAPWLATKQQAIAAHASQMTELIADDPDGFHFEPHLLAPFLQPYEVLFEVPA